MNRAEARDVHVIGHPDVPQILNRRARHELDMRKLRVSAFGRPVTRDVVWEMLLILYVDTGKFRNTIATLIKTADVPLTTGLRWLAYLEDRMMISRTQHPTDARRVSVELTAKGIDLLNAYFSETFTQPT